MSSNILLFYLICPRSALCDSEAHGRPIQYLLCICSHQTQPANSQSSHQPGHRRSHPLHVLAALLLRAQIRYYTTSYFSTADVSLTLSAFWMYSDIVIRVFCCTVTGLVHPITLFTLASLISCITCYLFRLCLRKTPNKSTSYQVCPPFPLPHTPLENRKYWAEAVQ